MNIAIILAGGSGERVGHNIPKQFLTVAGKEIIEHTIEAFAHHPLIDEVCIVTRPDYVMHVRDLVASKGLSKVKHVLEGGKERYDSSMAALRVYTDDNDCLLFHDAVRPLVDERIITDCIEALRTCNAVDVAVHTTDTIIEVDSAECIRHIPNRQSLRNSQTPQCFRRSTICRAYQLALQDPAFTTTDDCGVVHRYLPEEPIRIVPGSTFNIKLTYAEDLSVLERLFQLRVD